MDSFSVGYDTAQEGPATGTNVGKLFVEAVLLQILVPGVRFPGGAA